MQPLEDNMALWNKVQTTDPDYAKAFQRAGGFRGTAVNGLYLQREATRVFGPKGRGWEVKVLDEKYVPGHDQTVVHVVRIRFEYMYEGVRGSIEQYGQTTFVGKNKSGWYTDEEAPKKSLTDATSKALSELGFSSDIWLGMWDDNKYVEQVTQAKQQKSARESVDVDKIYGCLEHAAQDSIDVFRETWKKLSKTERQAISQEELKELAAICGMKLNGESE